MTEPVRYYTLRTALPPAEVVGRLRRVVGNKAPGRLRGTTFVISAARTGSRVPWSHRLSGEISQAGAGSLVTGYVRGPRFRLALTSQADVDRLLGRLTRLLEADAGSARP